MERRSDCTEQSGSKVGQVNRHLRWSYDANFKIMVVNAAEASNNCQPAKKYGVTLRSVTFEDSGSKKCLKMLTVKAGTNRPNRWACEAFGETRMTSGTNMFGVFSCVGRFRSRADIVGSDSACKV